MEDESRPAAAKPGERPAWKAGALSILLTFSAIAAGCSATPAASSSAPDTSAAPTESAAASTVSDTPTRGNAKKQFAFAIGLQELPIIQALEKRMTQQANLRGWEVLYDTGTGANIQSMIPSVEAWITAGVPSITVAPFEPAAWESLAKRAVEKGLIWNSYNQLTETRYAGFGFGVCPQQAKLMAEKLIPYIQANDPTAKVFISTNVANPAVACKWDGLKADIEAATDATVLSFQDANTEPDGLKVMAAVLQANPDVSIAIGTNDDVARGMERAFVAAGKDPAKVLIGGFDAAEPNLREIKEGTGFIKVTSGVDLIDLADLLVEKNILLALSSATEPPATPDQFDVTPYAMMKGDPQIDVFLEHFDLLK